MVETTPVSLQVSADSDALAQDKLVDFVEAQQRLAPLAPSGAGRRPQGFTPVTMGTIGSQLFSNFAGSTESGEPGHGGGIGGASEWIGLAVTNAGVLVVDTLGSDLDTLMAVYTGTNLASLQLVAEDDNGAPDGVRSLVRVSVATPTNYLVAVDALSGLEGTLQVNWQLGLAPVVTNLSAPAYVFVGQPLALQVGISSGTNAFRCQWWLNGEALTTATNTALNIAAAGLANAGTYSIVVSNTFGVVSNTVGTVAVYPLVSLTPTLLPQGNTVDVRIVGTPGPAMLLEGSTSLLGGWTPVFTNTVPNTGIDCTIGNAGAAGPARFYRARPWP